MRLQLTRRMTLSEVRAQSKSVVCWAGEPQSGLRSNAWGMTASTRRRTTKPNKKRMTDLLLPLLELMVETITFRASVTIACRLEYYSQAFSKSMLLIQNPICLTSLGLPTD